MSFIEPSKVYGPFKNYKNREFVILIYPDGSRKTTAYARYLYEKHHNVVLAPDDTVDHIDRNKKNNTITNLKIVPRAEHSSLDTKKSKDLTFKCPICKQKFKRKPKLLRDSHKRFCAGPFCSKSCAAIYSSRLRQKLIKKLPRQPFKKSRYFRDKK
jgi:endogenous inhibitor of DNA gyrase (YacG/DUF329 family)